MTFPPYSLLMAFSKKTSSSGTDPCYAILEFLVYVIMSALINIFFNFKCLSYLYVAFIIMPRYM